MKFLVVFLAVLAVVCGNSDEHHDDEWKPKTFEEFMAIRAECIKETGLTDSQLAQLQQLNFPNEEQVRKYLLCAQIKLGYLSPEKGFHAERMIKQFKVDVDETEMIEAIKSCSSKNEEGSSTDVWTFRDHDCIIASKMGEKVKAYFISQLAEAAKKASEENKL